MKKSKEYYRRRRGRVPTDEVSRRGKEGREERRSHFGLRGGEKHGTGLFRYIQLTGSSIFGCGAQAATTVSLEGVTERQPE